jgi:hypothetical protein
MIAITLTSGGPPGEMVSTCAELRQLGKGSLVCVTSMVNFQVFVRIPKLCRCEKEFKPYLTWGEEHDLKLAEMKRLQEQDEARVRGGAACV